MKDVAAYFLKWNAHIFKLEIFASHGRLTHVRKIHFDSLLLNFTVASCVIWGPFFYSILCLQLKVTDQGSPSVMQHVVSVESSSFLLQGIET